MPGHAVALPVEWDDVVDKESLGNGRERDGTIRNWENDCLLRASSRWIAASNKEKELLCLLRTVDGSSGLCSRAARWHKVLSKAGIVGLPACPPAGRQSPQGSETLFPGTNCHYCTGYNPPKCAIFSAAIPLQGRQAIMLAIVQPLYLRVTTTNSINNSF